MQSFVDWRQALQKPIAAIPWIGFFSIIVICVIVIEFPTVFPAWTNTPAKVIAVGASTACFTRFLGGMGMFRDAIADVLGDDKWLDRRNDLEDLWRRVSRRVFMPGYSETVPDSQAFLAALNEAMTRVIRQPVTRRRGYYTRDTKRRVDVRWKDKEKKIVEIVDTVDCTVVVFDVRGEETYDVVVTPTAGEAPENYQIKLTSVEVDGQPHTPPQPDSNGIVPIPLKGARSHHLTRTIVFQQRIESDPLYLLAAGHVVWGMNVFLTNEAAGLRINHEEIGSQGLFRPIKKGGLSWELDTESVLLPEQGIALIFAAIV